jgi:hypothetical protein
VKGGEQKHLERRLIASTRDPDGASSAIDKTFLQRSVPVGRLLQGINKPLRSVAATERLICVLTLRPP